ncbi:MAG: holo-ACP synthase [Anaerolineales bacterium]|nr:holo-ACP synthase [Anaerolineales bacterium]
MIRVGVDLVEVDRIESLLERYGDRFARRIFTDREFRDSCRQPERLAARFAAKEAVSKALGTGIGSMSWRHVEVVHDEKGMPNLILSGAAADIASGLGLVEWAISLSHTQKQAIAFVVGTG